MAHIMLMPKLGLTMKKGKIVSWLKKEGEAVDLGEALLEVMTEKVNINVESPYKGVLYKIIGAPGTSYPISVPLAVLAEEGDDAAALEAALDEAKSVLQAALAGGNDGAEKKKEAKPVKPFGVFAGTGKVSPRAAKLAAKEGIAVELINGSGPNGKIVEADVLNYILQVKGEAASELRPIDPQSMRGVIADRMLKSRREAAHVTIMKDVDMTSLQDVRDQLNTLGADKRVKFSFTDFLVKFTGQALAEYPLVNSRSTAKEIELAKSVHVGVAVALEEGLVVPNVKNVPLLSLEQISAKIKDLAARARNSELDPSEIEQGTFTITNLGAYGVEGFTPIINRPETAILGVGTIKQKPVMVDGRLENRYFMTLSLSFDHRIIDGSLAAEFLGRLIEMLENPYPWFQLQPQSNDDLLIQTGGQETPHDLLEAFSGGIAELKEEAPELAIGFENLMAPVFCEGELGIMEKELMAVAVAVYGKCEYCIAAHVYNAMNAGASADQVLEAAGVAVAFGGGPAMAYTVTKVRECVKAFGG
ncbi:alkylhydroperoxidase AhpD family core domain protein [Desulfosporosinus orientis DSM 765]|uniref:Dihydrolipoamide acetyltransferase component of pyruvate dehydrogenase complex n=1 Tax=Desulfosporosinus orientis (strain ATCC 19365 / DSM 765 / NCIMB 8382 / VKM B-1628 / Singapore I) TaxID=768706 RepID=G7WJA0_DESOD|nr:2-oxo acid dehydrogenase subunit E2 [Desulfosporosinus orientis]AET69759.1 alkylhydroperoxidase AhpD family core domain protein [Desulfosporosinus orientis DSM 765]